jgi:hypothetical protein
MSDDDVYSYSFSFDELGGCEVNNCTNKASEIIDVVIPWKPHEPGKWYLCLKCRRALGV